MQFSRASLGAREFRLLRDLFLEVAGLQFEEASRNSFERRLGERLEELGFADFHDYYQHLRFSPDGKQEIAIALEVLTTAETYFMRQQYQLNSFQQEVLPIIAKKNRNSKRLVVWSAGCSTGEEVYTLAILIRESGLFEGWNIRVIGSDLSRRRVAHARGGVYRTNSFRTTSPDLRKRYFVPLHDMRGWQVKDEIKSMCHFGQLNLTDSGATAAVGRVDVIFCRNVLIYFGEKARAQVIDNLYTRLVAGGYLFLGHSESLLNVSTAFELVHLSEDLAYRKPASSVRF